MKTTLKISAVAVVFALSGCNQNDSQAPANINQPTSTQAQAPGDVSLRLIETSDIHANLRSFDYYQDEKAPQLGFARTAVLIKKAREENPNNLLIDNGDLIQGTPLADYIHQQFANDLGSAGADEAKTKAFAEQWFKKHTHPAIKALNVMKYDVGNLGNHEFNFGLDFLKGTLSGANYPYINANVFQADAFSRDGKGAIDWSKQYFKPYVILERQVIDVNGKPQTIKVGFLGLTPPQITMWDKSMLEGKVVVADMVETAEHYIPQMQANGADLIVVVAHTGLIGGERVKGMEHAALPLAKVKGVNALLIGHAHREFPGDKSYANIKDVDNVKGTLAGIPTVMPAVTGTHLGVIDLKLTWQDGRWQVASSKAGLRKIDSSPTSYEDPDVVDQLTTEHQETREWLKTPISKITQPFYSYFARVQPDPSIQIVNDAQLWRGKELQKEGLLPEPLPILAVAAPFRGGRNGPKDYTYVPTGELSLRNIADLYVFPNTVQVVKITGATVKEWLEKSAVQYNQIDITNTGPQDLINEQYRSYCFDVISGVKYEVDVTKPARYTIDGVKVSDSSRITKLTYQGQPVDPDQYFYVVTNNYRASGGCHFPGIDGKQIVLEDGYETPRALSEYLTELARQSPKEGFTPKADEIWHFAKLPANLDLRFYTSPSPEAQALAAGKYTYLKTMPPKGTPGVDDDIAAKGQYKLNLAP
ncbi:bifunctional 2',3'-cyclic-nucleotide 2'-phosphodiesterase/3'-nucleotidase [Aeromonas finlandensis]|uniref:bifunctional 2',3'-cyclic-nucleotide 2'-phosphodiesterase/3'-nucleotidase n=1 Tax=Aeromonas finlandensis TaxID=1543375 RepID=UPI0009DEBE09|nr:bifunctional 2',3'-cyclic-nucleotide 2'-phosphodiesterase/3'-nucleotidase [Aeromonas finlandensis]